MEKRLEGGDEVARAQRFCAKEFEGLGRKLEGWWGCESGWV